MAQAREREAQLSIEVRRLKEGLAKRVVRQWTLLHVGRAYTAWREYVARRCMQRELKLEMSDEEPIDTGPPPNKLTETMSSVAATIVALPSLF